MSLPRGPHQHLKSGWLRKQGGALKNWQRRWFVLNGDCLFYFAKDDDLRPLGSIFLPGNKVIRHEFDAQEPEKFLFEVVSGTVNVLKIWTPEKNEHPEFIFSPRQWSKGINQFCKGINQFCKGRQFNCLPLQNWLLPLQNFGILLFEIRFYCTNF